ncbi:sulfurtransferase TusA [Buchnera aphidicola (Kurisakia onigurumii)]|uniref:sulfurtransferase TusA n=1 Tax=Buchnera aphidicola TaxID=9 RepID=UPI0031B6AF6A
MKNKKKYKYILNLNGLKCPDPIIQIRKSINKIKKKEKILVITDDFSTKREIKIFCRIMNHILLEIDTIHIPYKYIIEK